MLQERLAMSLKKSREVQRFFTHYSYYKISLLKKRLINFSLLFICAWLGLHHVVSSRLIEIVLIVGVLYVLAGYKPLVDCFSNLNHVYKYFTVGLLVFLAFGQVARKDHRTFPFLTWGMYGNVPRNRAPTFYEYIGKLRSGANIPFYPVEVLPAAGFRIMNELANRVNAIETAKTLDERTREMTKYQATLKALVHLYNKDHKDDPILTIFVSKYQTPLDNYKRDAITHRQFLMEIDVSD